MQNSTIMDSIAFHASAPKGRNRLQLSISPLWLKFTLFSDVLGTVYTQHRVPSLAINFRCPTARPWKQKTFQ